LVLPVGGIKEKVLAAKRAGLTRVLLPALNRRDLEDIPAGVLQNLRFEFLNTVDEALKFALEVEDAISRPADLRNTGELGAGPSA
jgi:ATP-dependent Lon protease